MFESRCLDRAVTGGKSMITFSAALTFCASISGSLKQAIQLLDFVRRESTVADGFSEGQPL